MKNYYILICFVCFGFSHTSYAQKEVLDSLTVIDSLYKEDQFYFSITYNILSQLPSGIDQTGFSLGLHAGFIKDMPLNKQRNIALGIGLGYSYSSYNQNLGIIKDDDNVANYFVLDDSYEFDYSKNNFYLHMLELPIEFRWRTSTPSDYRFWRVYAGFKVGYVFSHITNFQGEVGHLRYTDIEGFNNFQYGLTLSAGYNTWNFYVYYALNPIFNDDVKTVVNQDPVKMTAIKLGLIFYLL
ncbi:porin family protein [uncultured Formosa sp.]|uniref:porin family protein n=1 Tax=uncultured Formosa sp. TaxID=255435 RepID=UPI0026227FA0|nr:porin family protein [uncultured Formosa sp.]